MTKEEIARKKHEYYLKNKAAYLERAKKWAQGNPEKYNNSTAKARRKYDAKRKGERKQNSKAMNKRLKILTAVLNIGKFSTAADIALHLEPAEFNTATNFDKKKLASQVSGLIGQLCSVGYLVKIAIPKVATYYGSPKWILQDKPIKDYLPDESKPLIDDFVIVPVVRISHQK